jgi:putative nucleotidyltransferase with HDIG domain
MLRTIFVDDEPNVLGSIRRMLHGLRQEWDMKFVESGCEALDLLTKEPFDVIVSDMRMPQMDGAQLLTEVKKLYPHMVRIILSGHSDRQMILKSVQSAHQFLSKPSDADTLKLTVSRTHALKNLLAEESLKGIVSKVGSLPSLPTLYAEIMNELQSSDPSIQKIGQIISKDLGMATKVLHLVNSAFFGIPRHIENPGQAVSLLGIDTIKALVLTVEVFSKFDQAKIATFDIEKLWDHSIITGELAKQIAKSEEIDKQSIDDAYMAGLLHDIGKLVLVVNFSDKYKKVMQLVTNENITLFEAENQVFMASHAEVGAYLLGLWGFPNSIIEALAFHHNPRRCPMQSFSPLVAVHVADAMENKDGQSSDSGSVKPLLDHEYLKELDLSGRIDAWQGIYACMQREETNHA